MKSFLLRLGFLIIALPLSAATPDYAEVHALIAEHCVDCHAAQDPEGKLVLESFEALQRGGESGVSIMAGKSAESLLIQMVEGKVVRDGKPKIMPPGKRAKLTAEQIQMLRSWIDAGAQPPAQPLKPLELVIPKIAPTVTPRRSVRALTQATGPKLIAIGRENEIELRSADNRALIRTLSGHRGSINALAFTSDGKFVFAAAGEPGRFGEVGQWNSANGELVRTWEGHTDALYALALSPDNKTLATGSYDQKIKLWNADTGEELKTLSGHNGAVFDLAFRPDGKLLASASADRTVKLWDVATGQRRDTLAQSLKELFTVAFSPDGTRLVAGGVDNRIRLWEISPGAAETTNPLLDARFGHEGAILKLVFAADGKTLASSADDRTVKLWNFPSLEERLLLEKQPDWVPALTFLATNKTLVTGRLDGTTEFYDAANGKVAPPPAPVLARIEPMGLQRGVTSKLKLEGTNLHDVTQVKFHNPKLHGTILPGPTPNELWMSATAEGELPRGAYEVSVTNAGGESGKIKVYVDDLPQSHEHTNAPAELTLTNLPVSCWGRIDPRGDVDGYAFEAAANQTVVFEVSAQNFGSKANLVLTLVDGTGRVVASNNDFAESDPLIAHTFAEAGRYVIRIHDLTLGASRDHFYRLSIGSFPYVAGCFPNVVPAGKSSAVQLLGFNLPTNSTVTVEAKESGEIPAPIDHERYRSRSAPRLLVEAAAVTVETEPNDQTNQAMSVTPPISVNGRIMAADSRHDSDLFRFTSKTGEIWVVETEAARRGSPVDTRLEILHVDGRPVTRCLLQAVRDSAITFRAIDSSTPDCRVEKWEEMELNQLLYLQGEVVKIFRMPQGPDSGFLFYTSGGKRRAYFDTSATSHALDEPCYIVTPLPPNATPIPNGLPSFPLFYANDDDGERRLGTDSRLLFTAPGDGDYLVRVSDTRNYAGERFTYRLNLRPAKPDFQVTLNGVNLSVARGSGQSFGVSVERTDGFTNEVTIDINHLPAGLSASTPIVIEAGHDDAKGSLHASADVVAPDESACAAIKVTASAFVQGHKTTKDVNNFGRIKVTDKPKLLVFLEPDPAGATNSSAAPTGRQIIIAPGQTVPALLRLERNGHDDLVTFSVENLPHGVIVDNIGLSGVLIPKGQNERQIFLTAAKWVPETERFCYALESQAGRQTSLPLLLKVRRDPRVAERR